MNSDYTRRAFLWAGGAFAAQVGTGAKMNNAPKEMMLYVGTYTRGASEGIYIYRMNLASGELRRESVVKGIVNPSYLSIDRERKFLYSVSETGDGDGKPSGALSAFAIDQQNGSLKFLNQQATRGTSPCYVSLIGDGGRRFALVANYSSGSVSVLPIEGDGRLGATREVIQHRGGGPNRERQAGPHAHCVVPDDNDRHAFAVDLGVDKVLTYRFDAPAGKLTEHASVAVKPGAGPRHIAFHPSRKYAYVINELDSTITALDYRAAEATFAVKNTVSTLPPDFAGENSCADIHVAPSGKFLYGSNRGHDSVVVFAIDERGGELKYVEHTPTRGKTPRNFVVDPSGAFLLAANQNSDSIAVFRIDQARGTLSPVGDVVQSPTPVCLKLIPAFS